MSKKIKVLHLCAVNTGGAYEVASAVNRELNVYPNINSKLLLLDSLERKNEYGIINGIFRKILWLYYFGFEKFQFLFHERDKSIRFAFSHSPLGFKLSKNKLFRDAEIVHFHWVNKGFLSINEIGNLLEHDKKFIWTLHDFWPLTGGCFHPRGCLNYLNECGNCHYLKKSNENDLSYKVYQQKKETYTRNNKIIWCCPSKWMQELMGDNPILTGNRINFIPNPVGFIIDNYRKSGFDNQNFKQLKLLFISSNLSNPYKGFNNLEELCKYLTKERQILNMAITVIGDFKSHDIKRKQYYSEIYNLKFIGIRGRKELFEELHNSHLYLNLSEEETFGLTNIEALYNGTPVVAFDLPAYKDIIIEDYSGWVFKKGDIQAMGKKIIELGNSRSNIDLLRANCKKIAKNYTVQNITKQYLSVYQK